MSKVSIIVPMYNVSAFVEETIRSVQKQTYTDWEMILVDDFSIDGTYEIVKRIASSDKRLHVLRNKENMGVAQTRNRALDEATGDYIAFLDSDDLWLPEKLEKQLQFMEKGKYALTYTLYQKFNSNTGKQGKVMKAPKIMNAKKIYGNTSIGCLTVMINRKITGPFYMPDISHMEDNVTWQEILSRGYKGYLLEEVLALYREGNASLTNSKKKAARQQWSVYREYYGFSVLKSAYFFFRYAINAIKRHWF